MKLQFITIHYFQIKALLNYSIYLCKLCYWFSLWYDRFFFLNFDWQHLCCWNLCH